MYFSRRLLMVLLLMALLAIPVGVMAAGGTFTDDDSSIFESDIEWLAATGVTKGCNPPMNDLFCPNDAVSRGAMAAFMHRYDTYLGRSGVARERLNFSTTSTTPVELQTISVDVPGPGTLLIEIDGQYWLDLDAVSGNSVFGYVQLAICDSPATLEDADCGSSVTDARYSDPDNVTALNATPGIATSRVVDVTTAGTMSFSINGFSSSGATFFDWFTYVQVTFLPGDNAMDGALTVSS